MTSAAATHKRMIDDRQIDEDRRYVRACDDLLANPAADYSPELLAQIRQARDARQQRLDSLTTRTEG